MKLLCSFSLAAGLLCAQPPSRPIGNPGRLEKELIFELVAAAASGETGVNKTDDDSKIFFNYVGSPGLPPIPLSPPLPSTPNVRPKETPPVPIGSVQTPYSAVGTVVAPFYNQFPNGAAGYSPLLRPRSEAVVYAELTTVQPVAPVDPRLIFLDGLGNSLIAMDETTLTVVSQVVVPSTTGPFGIRPNATSASNEVWVLNSGFEVSSGVNEVSVVDLGGQSVVANIATPSAQAGVPVGIVFTTDGATAFEAIKYDSADSAGNNGALVVFNAASRTVTSTMLLKSTPYALVMARDGLTAYLLATGATGGTITYYDVLSGTADLTVSLPNYNPFAPVFIHPDGTRLFWNTNAILNIFYLTTRQVITVTSGLPSTASPTFSMSQDGGRVYFSDQAGDVVVLDTIYGFTLASFNAGAAVSIFGGPPVAP